MQKVSPFLVSPLSSTVNGATSTVNLALYKDLNQDLILKKPKREVRLEWWKWKKLHMERHYEGSHILFLESKAQSMSLPICISFYHFLPCFYRFYNLRQISFQRILLKGVSQQLYPYSTVPVKCWILLRIKTSLLLSL